jgi:hypothetical protein
MHSAHPYCWRVVLLHMWWWRTKLGHMLSRLAAAICAVVGSAAVPAVSPSHLWKHMLMPKQIWSTQNIMPMENLVLSKVNQQLCTTQTTRQVGTVVIAIVRRNNIFNI